MQIEWKILLLLIVFFLVQCTHKFEILTSTSVAVSESPLSLPSGKSCNSAEMQSGSSTDVRDVDFCDGILRRDRTLMPDWERGICGEVPPSDDASTSPSDFRAFCCASFKRLTQKIFKYISFFPFSSFNPFLLTCNNLKHRALVV